MQRFVWALLATVWVCAPARAAMDLAQAFELARQADPSFQASRQELAGLNEVVPQARAALLPNVSASASRNRVWLDRQEQGGDVESNYFSLNNSLVVRQPLWRRPQMLQLEQAKTQAATQAFVQRRAEADLLLRVASTYFDLLYADQSQALLRSVAAASAQQLVSARRSFELGQGTRTDIDEAQARSDLALAQSVQVRQNRDMALRQMAMLVGQEVQAYKPMRIEASEPLRPPGSLDEWLAKAKQHNPELQLARTKLALAELEVTKTQAAHDPTLDLVAQRSLSKSENTQSPNASYRSSQVGVQLNVPLYAGGGVQSAVRQAVANREREQFVVAQASNDLALKVQREYHALAEGPERLQAARQALRSASQLVFSTSKGIQAGTRTVVDQLNAVQREAETRRELALVHYQLQLAWLNLAALSGEELQASVDEVNRQLQALP